MKKFIREGNMAAFKIGDREFKNKSKALEFYKGILNSREAPNFEDMMALVLRHPSACTLIEGGVDSFFVAPDNYGNKCFNIIRKDGSTVCFSYLRCVNAKPASWEEKFKSACRNAVRTQIVEYRAKYFETGSTCMQTGVTVSIDDCHVDHCGDREFRHLLQAFIQEYNLDISDLGYEHKNQSFFFSSPEIEESFASFHRERAKLQVVSKAYNLAKTKNQG